MNKNYLKVLIVISLILTQHVSADENLDEKIKYLENNLANLQNQINQLKAELGGNLSKATTMRIERLEAYAIELHDVLTEVQDQVEENKTEVRRISEIQNNLPNLGVYSTIDAYKYNNQDTVLDGQSFELILSGQPHKRISYFTELEFERAATVGGSRGGEVLLEQAYSDIKINSWANFRGGILLVPFGNIEMDHYAPLRDTISKPYTSYALAPSDWTDNGFGINGKFSLSDEWIIDYQTYIITGLDEHISTTGLRATRQGFGVDNNNNKAVSIKFSLQNTEGFKSGLSYYKGAWNDNGDKNITGYNLDFNYDSDYFSITGEYTLMNVDRETSGTAKMDGYYIRGKVPLQRFMPDKWLGEDFPHAQLELVGQYDTVNVENFFDLSIADNWEKRLTIGLNFKPTSSWILKLNYEDSHAEGADNILRGSGNAWLFSLGYVF